VIFDESKPPSLPNTWVKKPFLQGILGSKDCYKISIGASTKALKGTDKNIIWLTADNAKVPAKSVSVSGRNRTAHFK
jgi:hypothetical protein